MKVFFTVDALINAGTEKSILDIVINLPADINVKVFYFYPRHELKEVYNNAGVSLHFLNLRGKYSFFQGISKFRKILKEEKPDVVVSSIYRTNIMSRIACYLTKTKLVGTFVSDSYSPKRIKTFSLSRRISFNFFLWLDRITSGIPVKWISNSKSIAESNCRALSIDPFKVEVNYRGRSVDKIKEWNTPPVKNVFVFSSIGRLLETKGYSDLINAIKKVREIHPEIFLNIYGEGTYRTTLENMINNLGLINNIKLHGAVPDAWSKLYESHCFVFPSWNEGFSGALVEAMMMGIPLIASDIPMNLEAITNNKTALVHKVQDAEDIADKMIYMVENYHRMIDMGKRARVEAIERFEIVHITNQYANILKTVARG